jgi:hypothetical protein
MRTAGHAPHAGRTWQDSPCSCSGCCGIPGMQRCCPTAGRAGLLLVAREPAAHARLVRVRHARRLRRQARQARRHARLRAVQLTDVAARVRRPLARARQRGRQRGQRPGGLRRAHAVGAGAQARRLSGLEGGRGRLEAGGEGRGRERGRGRCLPRRVVPLRACACQGALSAERPNQARQGGMREIHTWTKRAAVTARQSCSAGRPMGFPDTAAAAGNQGRTPASARPHLHACVCTRNRCAAAEPLNYPTLPYGAHRRAGWRPSRP